MSGAPTRAARALAASGAGAAATLATEVAITLARVAKATENCMLTEVNGLWGVENSVVGLCLYLIGASTFLCRSAFRCIHENKVLTIPALW